MLDQGILSGGRLPARLELDAALARLRDGDAEAALDLLAARPPSSRNAAHYAALGMARLAAGEAAAALSALHMAVVLGDPAPATLLNLALAEQLAGAVEPARQRMRRLAEQMPDWDEPRLRLAESFRHGGDRSAAETEYERVLDLTPTRPEALIGLGVLLLQRGEAARAQLLLLRCCGAAPDRGEAWDALGMALCLTGDAAAAEAAFAEAQRRDPLHAGIALRRIEAAMDAGAGEQELARLDVAAIEDPLNPALLTARGALLDRLGQRDEAIDVLEAAALLAPDLPEAAAALAHALVRANRMIHAVRALERAVALAPGDLTLRNNHAAALVRLHRHREAREALEALIAEHGEQPGFLCNLTNALVSLGLQAEGLAHARRAVELAPGQDLGWRTLCNALPYCEGIGGAELLEAYRRAGAALPRGAPAVLGNAPDPHRRLRIGLLSATLKTHPVGWLTLGGLENLDPAQFEIVCLAQPESDDALARRFRALAAEWHVLDRHAGTALAERIRSLRIDILIDLSGYGDQGLMTLCAQRLAPVQMKWVGSQNHSTGLAEMDWFVSDRWETPPHLHQFYSERLLLLPDGYVCYSPPAYAPDVGPPPVLCRGFVTFGCFNNLAKVTSAVIAAWAGILRDVPDARFVLKCHQMDDRQTRERLLGDFAGHGIPPGRIELRGSSPHRALLAEYADIDIVLDPFPYSGGLTTCEALWMGVPTVTMPGETFASRHSASHLSNVGLAGWIAGDLPEYRALAMRHAADHAALAGLRAGMRARLLASPLCDSRRFGRNFGIALRSVWAEWCARP